MSYVDLRQEDIEKLTTSELWEALYREQTHERRAGPYRGIYHEAVELCKDELAKRMIQKADR